MVDLYHAIYESKIFTQSRCIWHENIVMDWFRSQLISLGYQAVQESNKVWCRGRRKVIVCLADDFSTCSADHHLTLPYLFDQDTTVITDNRVCVPTQYRVIQLPASFFGIYYHEPDRPLWQPDRRLAFSVNRLDHKRLLMMLEIALRSTQGVGSEDYVNFNCWDWDGDNASDDGRRANFARRFGELDQTRQAIYGDTFDSLHSRMPFCNYDFDVDLVHTRAWLNLVMETYSGDSNIALSEKTFRALSLPVPWMVYAGRHAISYLHSLGFDVMMDTVDHTYDHMLETQTAAYGDKIVDFLYKGVKNVQVLQTHDWTELSERAENAAQRNISLLRDMRTRWPQDFADWWPGALAAIK